MYGGALAGLGVGSLLGASPDTVSTAIAQGTRPIAFGAAIGLFLFLAIEPVLKGAGKRNHDPD